MKNLIAPLLLSAFLALATACGSDEDDSARAGSGAERMEIGRALEAANGSNVTVSGHLIVDVDGDTRLCSLLLESFPPQCGGDRISLIGLEVSTVPDTKSLPFSAGGIRTVTWTGLITVTGIKGIDGLVAVQISSGS